MQTQVEGLAGLGAGGRSGVWRRQHVRREQQQAAQPRLAADQVAARSGSRRARPAAEGVQVRDTELQNCLSC